MRKVFNGRHICIGIIDGPAWTGIGLRALHARPVRTALGYQLIFSDSLCVLFKLFLLCSFVNISCPLYLKGRMVNLFQRMFNKIFKLRFEGFNMTLIVRVFIIVVIHIYRYEIFLCVDNRSN